MMFGAINLFRLQCRAFVLEVSNRYGIASHKVRVTRRIKVKEMENGEVRFADR